MTTPAESSEEPGPSEAGPSKEFVGSKLFLGGLSWDTSEEKLRKHFESYGELIEVVVMRDRGTGRPRGFGFVTFKDPSTADEIVNEVHTIDGRQIDVKKSVPQEGKPRACKIFVGGLSPETSEDDFQTYFSQFGDVAEVQIMQDHMSGRSRGFGFVTFVEDNSAEKVFAAGQMHELGGKRVEVKPATPKGAGSQTSRTIPPPRGTGSDYSSNMMPPLASFGAGMGPAAGYQAYNPNVYGYGPRPGGVPYGGAPYGGSAQYPGMPPTQYMMMQPPYPPTAPYPQYQQYHLPHHQGGPPPHNPFVRVSPQYPISPMPSPPYGPNVPTSRARSGRNERNKVDSASSLDQQQAGFERQLRKLNLE